jgi:hypothetical protein
VSAERDPVFGCELVTSRLDRDGYAYHGRSRAHIVAWEREHGQVPEGKELDHLCRRRNCIAVHHLESVTRGENERRKSWRYRARVKWCPAGHALELYAVVTPEGGRVCRRCNQIAAAGDQEASA